MSFIAVAALLANAQCYNACTLAACTSAHTPSNGCHHHKSAPEDDYGCHHQHPELIGPESGIAKLTVESAMPILALLTAASEAEPLLLSEPDTGSPPGDQVRSAISVLRI